MKTGEAAKILGVDVGTVRKWIDLPHFARYFSISAKGEHGAAQRLLTEDDILILNTIRALRTRENADWERIIDYLETGRREQEFPENAITADPRTIPLAQAEQSAKAMATLVERDAALAKVVELSDKVTTLEYKLTRTEHERDQLKEDLLREIADLNRQIGRLEGLLEASQNGDRAT